MAQHATMGLMESYYEGIRKAYEGEIVGEALYRLLSERSTDSARRRKLAVIAAVERRTRDHLESIATRLGIKAQAADIQARIERRAVELASLEWPAFIEKALRDWPPFIDEFEATLRLAPARDARSVRWVVDHERALVEFARLEQAGCADSLKPIEAFLEEARR
jgi:hypothetical protein